MSDITVSLSELGTSLFQIAQLLNDLEQTLISGAKEQYNKNDRRLASILTKSHFERFAHERFREKRVDQNLKYRTVKICRRDGTEYCKSEFVELKIQFI